MNDTNADQFEQIDRERLAAYCKKDMATFEGLFIKDQNKSRWCSVGNMLAAQNILRPNNVDLIDYQQVRDPNGMSMVSSAAIAFSQ